MNGRGPEHYGRGEIEPLSNENTVPMLLQFVGIAVALVIIVSGLSLAFGSFNLIRGIIEKPESLSGYLASWEGNLKPAEKVPDGTESAERPVDTDALPEIAETEEGSEPPEAPPQPAPPQPKTISGEPDTLLGLLNSLVEGVESGGIARPLGALYILLFSGLLVILPLSLVGVGGRILMGVIGKREKAK